MYYFILALLFVLKAISENLRLSKPDHCFVILFISSAKCNIFIYLTLK